MANDPAPGSRIIRVNSKKFDGSIRLSWTASIVKHDGPLLVLEGEFDREVSHPDLGLISKGTRSTEYYWLDRWYSIFRFHERDASLRNYYCNINLPPVLEGDQLEYIDLDIDILVWPDKSVQVLDLEEFEKHAELYSYPDEVRSGALKAKDELLALIARGEMP